MLRLLPHLKACPRNGVLLHVSKRGVHLAETKLQEKTVEEVRIPVPWGHIAGKWWGHRDDVPIIGLHGWEDNAGTFDKLAPLLKTKSFLAIDLPGHGLSTHLPLGKPYYLLDSVILLRQIIEYFSWEKVSFIGHSHGSCLSFIYSALFPNSVNNFISIDCARTLMALDEESELHHIRKVGDRLLEIEEKIRTSDPPSYTYEEIVDRLYGGSLESPTKDSCKILLKRGMLKSSEPNKYYFSRDPRLRLHSLGRFTHDLLLKLAEKIRCNHLSIRGLQGLIHGGEKEEIYFKTLELMKKLDYKFEHHDVEGTHHLHLNTPERIVPLINKFLSL